MKVSTAKLTANELKAIIDSQIAYLDEYYSNIDDEYNLQCMVIDLGHSFKVSFTWTYEYVTKQVDAETNSFESEEKTTEDWFKLEKGFKYTSLFKYVEEVVDKVIKDKINYESK